MRLAIGILSGLSALCELFGTWTVWVNYNRTSQAAQKVVAEMKRVQQRDEEYFTDPKNDLADRLFQQRDAQAEREEKGFVRTTFANAMSPLMPSRVTNYGLLAYVLGAILGLAAALFALS